MLMTPRIASRTAAKTLSSCLLAAMLMPHPAVQADITIRAQRLAGSGQTPPAPQAVTLFYKGADARLEAAGEPTLLYDGKSNILYGLNTDHKTYYMTVPTETEPADSLPSGPGGSVKEDSKLDLKQTSQTMTLAGVTAHQYIVTGTITFTRDRPQGEGHGGRRHRSGGFPGGGGFPLLVGSATLNQNGGGYGGGYGGDGQGGDGQNGEGRRGGSAVLPQWSMSGDIWLADTLKFPAKENTVLAAQLAAASLGPFQQPLADALDKHKGLPMLARISVTYTPGSSGGRAINQYGGVIENGPAASPAPATTVTTLTVQSVSTAPLADTLFQAPTDDTLVAAPLTPYDPSRLP